jgi:two-component system cell cycle sensor histidine kinase PleC
LTLILDISKIEAGRQPIQEDEFEVNRMLSAACRKYCLAANEKGVTLAIDDSAMLSVTGDATRLGRALACLLDNAIRFSPPGGIVRLSAAETNDGIALSVIDKGLGMDEGELAQALCPLRPMEEETRKRAVGLGLAYAKTLARAHGGRLVIETARGEGTAASIILPQARAVARAGETPSSFAPGA